MLSDSEYLSIKVKDIQGRYVINTDILDYLTDLSSFYKVETLGESVLGKPIKSIELGNGPIRILMWSQMHGNESTTTKAVLDLIKYFDVDDKAKSSGLSNCTLKIIPILNPDGAEAYTRVNANKIDLNRDAQDLSQPESIVLRNTFEAFRPDFCFNLHDQRTIYNVGDTNKPASVSFLSPSVNKERSIIEPRIQAMKLIAAMNDMLQKIIPGQVGRYDDGYNYNCVGDSFQGLGCPTILFEAGHFQGDYQRETTRKLIFQSLLTAISSIGQDRVDNFKQEDYFEIPENGKQFVDILVNNVHLLDDKFEKGASIALLYEEVLKDEKLSFLPRVEKAGFPENLFGHKIYDCENEKDKMELSTDNTLYSAITNFK